MQVTRSSDGGGPWPEPGKPPGDGQQLYLEDLHAGQESAQHRHRSKSDLPPSPSRARTRAPDQSPDQSLALPLSVPNSTRSCAYVSRSRCPVATPCCASWPMSYVVAAMSATASSIGLRARSSRKIACSTRRWKPSPHNRHVGKYARG